MLPFPRPVSCNIVSASTAMHRSEVLGFPHGCHAGSYLSRRRRSRTTCQAMNTDPLGLFCTMRACCGFLDMHAGKPQHYHQKILDRGIEYDPITYNNVIGPCKSNVQNQCLYNNKHQCKKTINLKEQQKINKAIVKNQ